MGSARTAGSSSLGPRPPRDPPTQLGAVRKRRAHPNLTGLPIEHLVEVGESTPNRISTSEPASEAGCQAAATLLQPRVVVHHASRETAAGPTEVPP
jgi:hypothetical protein